MRGKCKDLFVKLQSSQYNVLIFVETWLNDTFQNEEIFGDKWLVYRQDRNYAATNTSRGGGVLIAVHHTLASDEIKSARNKNCEMVFVSQLGIRIVK